MKPHIKKVKGHWRVVNRGEEVVSDWRIIYMFTEALIWCNSKNKEMGV